MRTSLSLKGDQTRAIDSLQQAILRSEEAVAATPQDHPNRAGQLSNWSNILAYSYERTGVMEHLQQSILRAEEAVAATPQDHPSRAGYLRNLSDMLAHRHARTGAMDDLQKAILRAEEAVAATPRDHPDRMVFVSGLGSKLKSRYDQTGAMGDLQQAILWAEETVAATPPDHPDRAGCLNNLGNRLSSRYERTGAVDDLQQAILHAEEAVATAPQDHPNRALLLNNLANKLGSRHRRTGAMGDLQQAILRAEEAVAATPQNHSNRAGQLSNLSSMLAYRYERIGAMGDLQQSILRAEEAVAATPQHHPNWAGYLYNLGNMIAHRYERLGAMDDLQQSIARVEEAVAATPRDHPNQAMFLNNLGNQLILRYKRTGAIDDLHEAILRAEGAVAATPRGHSNRALRLRNLGEALGSRYKRTGAMDDLRQAILRAEEAIATTPQNHPKRAEYLRNLSIMLAYRYERTGVLEDLQQAILRVEEAVAATPQDHPGRGVYLDNLSNMLAFRYERTGAMDDLQQAILLVEGAVATTAQDHPDRAGYLNNLSNMLAHRYRQTGAINDLQFAILHVEEAVATIPQDHPARAGSLSNLGNMLAFRYHQTGAMNDLHQAILRAVEAVVATPLNHPDRAMFLDNFGNRLQSKYERTGAMGDLQLAILQAEEAVAAVPQDHPNRAAFLHSLGEKLSLRYERTKEVECSKRSTQCFLDAWECRTAPPLERIRSARRAVRALVVKQSWEEASRLSTDVVELFPMVSPRSLRREDQQHRLSQLHGLAADAASLTLHAGNGAVEALRILELGRGVITGLSIDSRGEFADLKASHSDIFDEFNRIRAEIGSSTQISGRAPIKASSITSSEDEHLGGAASGISKETQRINDRYHNERRQRLFDEFDAILAAIRALPAYENFLRPLAPEVMKKVANGGSIVFFNCTKIRSDAIIVTSSEIKALPLPDLSYNDAVVQLRSMTNRMLKGTKKTQGRRNQELLKLFLWLWDKAVKPVCAELNLEKQAKDGWLPRVWWVGVGLMSQAPFHAAGYHSKEPSESVINLAVSSYTPTIKALSYAQECSPSSTSATRLTLVSMPITPGNASLPGVEKEMARVSEIANKFSIPCSQLIMPSIDDVLECLRDTEYDTAAKYIHFACHGVSNSENPSESHLLLLKDGSATSERTAVDKLTARDISNTTIKHAHLAYLAACHSADNPSAKLSDEAIHITSGFLLAGFKHVIGNLWQAQDEFCVAIAEEFYHVLLGRKECGEGAEIGVAVALHRAVKAARDKRQRNPLGWASFVHFGA